MVTEPFPVRSSISQTNLVVTEPHSICLSKSQANIMVTEALPVWSSISQTNLVVTEPILFVIYLSGQPGGHWAPACVFICFLGQSGGHWAPPPPTPSLFIICLSISQASLLVTEPLPVYHLFVYLSGQPGGHWAPPCFIYFLRPAWWSLIPSLLSIFQSRLVVTEPLPVYLFLGPAW